MARPKSTSDIKSSLLRPAQTSHFEVNITLPSELSVSRTQQDYMNLACSDASLPGSSLATGEVRDNFMGIPQEFAHTRLYADVDFTFYIDLDYTNLRIFEGWNE